MLGPTVISTWTWIAPAVQNLEIMDLQQQQHQRENHYRIMLSVNAKTTDK